MISTCPHLSLSQPGKTAVTNMPMGVLNFVSSVACWPAATTHGHQHVNDPRKLAARASSSEQNQRSTFVVRL
jgi:hypothetical protein